MFVAVGVGWPGVALLHLATHAVFETLLFLAPVAALLWIGDSMR